MSYPAFAYSIPIISMVPALINASFSYLLKP